MASAVGMAVLDVMEQERTMENSKEVGTYLLRQLVGLVDRWNYPSMNNSMAREVGYNPTIWYIQFQKFNHRMESLSQHPTNVRHGAADGK